MPTRLGITSISVGVDSSLVVLLLREDSRPLCHAFSNPIFYCRNLIASFLQASVHHILREGNQCADKLASLAQDIPNGVTSLVAPPSLQQSFLSADRVGIGFLRL